MAEVTYTAGYSIIAHLGKGKAIMGVQVAIAGSGDTITTPFMRCVPSAVYRSAAAVAAADDHLSAAESAGLITLYGDIAGNADGAHVVILGDMY